MDRDETSRSPSGFNPRPPITAGESREFAVSARRGWVSIRARQLRRANPTVTDGTVTWKCVSIRARQLRRANPGCSRPMTPAMPFQSAPANYGGRILGGYLKVTDTAMFQSAPANYGGRIAGRMADVLAKGAFQSAPANYGGRILAVFADKFRGVLVSIRARQLRRANPQGRSPPADLRKVSIRARQLRRANLVRSFWIHWG